MLTLQLKHQLAVAAFLALALIFLAGIYAAVALGLHLAVIVLRDASAPGAAGAGR